MYRTSSQDLELVDAPFCKSVSKSPWERKPNKKQGSKAHTGGKPNEKQSPKTHQEDRRARNVHKKKCKGKWYAAECWSTAEYRSAAEYSFLAEWLRQIKANWAQDPFDLVNIIWPTKVQILLYKRKCVKMKKHDEKKPGTTESVSSRNCVKERKSKPMELTNTAGNEWRTSTVVASFGNIPCWDGILPKRGSRWLGLFDARRRGRWWGRIILIHLNPEVEVYSKNKQKGILL